ncbi:Uncharacterized protein, DUF1786 family [Desulfurobacterium pacificum]|uniref:Uncharacterized protein, DUF1786 family n=1 Tax=Desulfurobacterium pacificum TaxID=240166 RepID=A0ABY1N927_9BACT|nr:DUF1786 domain-containing protein [Desulfurobacterium pacificum]SMP03772.1 Uncharacterized protein, DUF1786 family [Desulfurobacterium pacificum]
MIPVFVDIGKGTQDILIPLEDKNPENWIKAILPSPTSKYSVKLERWEKRSLKIDGKIMGGGPLKKTLVSLLERGVEVTLTKRFAKTIRDDLEEVEKYGFKVVDSIKEPNFFFQDIDYDLYSSILKLSGIEEEFNFLGVACQDHGFKKGQSDRVTRFQLLKKFLDKSRNPFDFYITEKTNIFSRFDSVLEQMEERNLKGFVVDSKIASICGILVYAQEIGTDEFVGLDIGNGHTLGVSIKKGLIAGIFEHHTRLLTCDKLKNLVEKLCRAELTFEEVYKDGGHGALVFEAVNPQKVLIAGPNRDLFKKYGEFAYPFGDVMITGCVGLYKIYHKNLQN